MMSGRATLADAVQATKLGAFHFIEKPLSPRPCCSRSSAVELRRARELSRTAAGRAGGAGERLVGFDAVMRRVRALIDDRSRRPMRAC
jgi:DNA-binding NtrC family response regulator